MTRTEIDTGSTELHCVTDTHVARVTLDNPGQRNAMTPGMTAALRDMLDRLEADPDIRVLVLTGAGGAFCAGGQVDSLADSLGGGGGPPDAEALIANLRRAQETLGLRLYEFPKPTIAALPGPAAGAGMGLALACDLRIAADTATLVPGFGRIGLSGDFGGSWFLQHQLGPARAKEICFLSRAIPAADALAWGLFNRVVPPGDLEKETGDMAAELTRQAPLALRYMKENHNRARQSDLRETMRMEADRMIRTLLTEDHREGAQAFLEKRNPVFRGR